MASPARVSGQASLLIGVVALAIAGAFTYVSRELTWLRGTPAESSLALMTFTAVGLLFQFATPALCAAAFFFGVPARELWTARSGMAAAVLSLGLYAHSLATCYRTITYS
jgi:hypothetical protein